MAVWGRGKIAVDYMKIQYKANVKDVQFHLYVFPRCPSSCLARGSADLHPFDSQSSHLLDPLLNQLCVRHFVHVHAKMIVVVVQDKPVDIDLADTGSDAALHQLRGKPIGAMKSQSDSTTRLTPNFLESNRRHC